MAKKQKSFYLEQDILDFIIDYQGKHQLSSPNVALERIIFSLMLGNNINQPQNNIKKNDNPISNEVKNSLNLIRNTMKD